MSITVNNTAKGGNSAAATSTTSSAINQTATHLIVVGVRFAPGNQAAPGNIPYALTLTDTAGNTYLPLTPLWLSGTNAQSQLFYCSNCLGNSSNIVTATFPSNAFSAIYVWDISSTLGTLAFDTQVSGKATISADSGSVTTPIFTTAVAEEIIIGFGSSGSPATTFTAGAGFSLDDGTFPTSTSSDYQGAEHLIVESIQSSVTASISASAGTALNGLNLNVATFGVAIPAKGFAPIPTSGGALAADCFARPDATGNTLTNGLWLTPNTTDSAIQTYSNRATTSSNTQATTAIFQPGTSNPVTTTGGIPSGNIWPNNQWCSCQVATYSQQSTALMGLLLRSQQGTSTQNYYGFAITNISGTTGTAEIYKYVAGSGSVLQSQGSITINVGSYLTFSIIGTTLTGYVNGVAVVTTTDASFSSGSPGIALFTPAGSEVGLFPAINMWRGGGFDQSGRTLVCIGDSIFGNWNLGVQFPGRNICECGVGSYTSCLDLARFNLDVISQNPYAVAIEGGRNGFALGLETIAQSTANFAAMGALAHAAGIKIIYVDTIASGGSSDPAGLGTKIDALNVNINAFTNGTYFSNWNLAIDNQTTPTTIIAGNYGADGIHPNATGYNLIAAIPFPPSFPTTSAGQAGVFLVGL